MKKYYNMPDYLKYIEQQNINRENAIKAIDCIISTITKFDGKIYNIKFNKECENKFKTVNLNNTYMHREEYGTWYLYVRDDDSYKKDPDGLSLYSSWNYINYTYYLPSLYRENDDKRIYSDILIPLFRDRQSNIQKQIDASTAEIAQIANIAAEYNAIKERISQFNGAVTPELRELFSFPNIY